MGYIGIDYDRGTTNRDEKTGICYGVISLNSVTQAWCDSSQPDYGKPSCPKCGDHVREYDKETDSELDNYRVGCADYTCSRCKLVFDNDHVYPDEPHGWTLDDGEYIAANCLDSDIMIVSSPYYTFAQFCSPCCPGAGNLDHPMADGVKTFCFGHDFFEDGRAPYPVYQVADDKEIGAQVGGC